MNDTFIAWAQSFDFNSAFRKITHHISDKLLEIARANKIALPHNAGRHTFITQMIAQTHDIPRVCQYAGTSPQMVQNNYNGLSFEDDATKFFALRPS